MKRHSIGMLLLLLTMTLITQGRQTAPETTIPPKSVTEAEREGVSHPKGEALAAPGAGFESGGSEGSTERKCVEFPVGLQPSRIRTLAADRHLGEGLGLLYRNRALGITVQRMIFR